MKMMGSLSDSVFVPTKTLSLSKSLTGSSYGTLVDDTVEIETVREQTNLEIFLWDDA